MRALLLEGSGACQTRYVKLALKDSKEAAMRRALVGIIRESALEFLCLNMDEEDLPEGFDPTTHEGRSPPPVTDSTALSNGLYVINI